MSVGRADLDGAAALGGAFDASVTGMAVVDCDGRFRTVNPALCRMLGREPGEIIGHPTTEFTHPDDHQLTESTMRMLLPEEREAEAVRKRYVRPDGSVVHVVRTTTVLRDEAGRCTGLLSQVVDVTEVAEAEFALRCSEARLEVLASHARELAVLVDRAGRIVYASPASERLLGWPPDSLAGRAALSLVHPDDRETAAAGLARLLAEVPADGTPPSRLSGVCRIRHRDGGWWPAEVHAEDLFAEPTVGALLCHIRDVSEQHAYRDQVVAVEERLRSLVGNQWDVVTLHDAEGRCVYASPAVTAELGWAPEELLGDAVWTIVHPDDTGVREAFSTVVGGCAPGPSVQYRARHGDGSWRWVESAASNRLADPAVGAVIVTTRDITLRRRRAAQQEAVASLSGLAVKGGPPDALFRSALDAVVDVLGVEQCAVLAERPDGRFEVTASHGPQPPGAPGGVDAVAPPFGVSTLIGGDGQRFGALTCYATEVGTFTGDDLAFIEATANVLAATIARDRMESELRRRASNDELTGLLNRSALQERLGEVLGRARCVAVMLIDADDFKLVNDSLGHVAGDRVVEIVAQRLVGNLRRDDTVSRFGGDEFVVLCEGAGPEEAAVVAERLRQVLATPMQLDGRQLALTVSIGVVVGSGDCSPDDLLARADTAMYVAKRAGKHRVALFDEAMRRRVKERLEVASGLRRAVENDELRLHYQPVFDVASGGVVGAEALLRWQHPSDGLLGPDRFIGYAEESGLITSVGEWVLEQAMRQAAQWASQGFAGRVAVNVSARQLADADLVDTVCAILERTGADTASLALEVTESTVMSDVDRAATVLAQLRSLGIQIGMDDFGTGHSSLSYLATLPFDFVKIDRSFVARFDQERRAAALLETIATLCRSLELPAIAEGVETESQLAEVERLGIAQVQGFLLGRPTPPSAFVLHGATGPLPKVAVRA